MTTAKNQVLDLYHKVDDLMQRARRNADDCDDVNDKSNSLHHSGQSYAYDVVLTLIEDLYKSLDEVSNG